MQSPLGNVGDPIHQNATTIPHALSAHRWRHANSPVLSEMVSFDQKRWLSVPTEHRQVIIRSLSQLSDTVGTVSTLLPNLQYRAEKRVEKDDPVRAVIEARYSAAHSDVERAAAATRGYCGYVEGRKFDDEALLGSYRVLHESLQERMAEFRMGFLEKDGGTEAEARVRTLATILYEGPIALTSLWLLSRMVNHLKNQNSPVYLPALSQMVGALARIERRNIAFGIFELIQLHNEAGTSVLDAVKSEHKRHASLLRNMRDEAFAVCAEGFLPKRERSKIHTPAEKYIALWLKSVSERRTHIRSLQEIL